MRVGSEEHSYNWVDNWGQDSRERQFPQGMGASGHRGHRVGKRRNVPPGDPEVMTFDGDGNFISSWRGDFADAHGITLVNEGGSSTCGLRITAPSETMFTATNILRAQAMRRARCSRRHWTAK